MILFMLLASIMILLIAFLWAVLSALGAGGLILCSDVIVCMFLIGFCMKQLWCHHKH